jgi:hypothetical protein
LILNAYQSFFSALEQTSYQALYHLGLEILSHDQTQETSVEDGASRGSQSCLANRENREKAFEDRLPLPKGRHCQHQPFSGGHDGTCA